MIKKTMLLKLPACFDLQVSWQTATDNKGRFVSYAKIMNFYLVVVHRPDGLFDCATRSPAPFMGHFNEGIFEVKSRKKETLIEAKLWIRNWYLKRFDRMDKWITNPGLSDVNSLATRCKYDGNLNIRNDITPNIYSIVFSNLKTSRISYIKKAIKFSNMQSAMDVADAYYKKRTKQNVKSLSTPTLIQ